MKKLIIIIICLLSIGCSLQPSQVKPNLVDYLPPTSQWDEEDIWKHNLPVNEIADNCLFSVKREGKFLNVCSSPCPCNPCKKAEDYSFGWYDDPWKAAHDASHEGKMVVVVLIEDNEESKEMLKRFEHPCTKKVVSRHYKAAQVDRKTYNMVRATSEKPVKWFPGDYFKAPSMAIMKVEPHREDGTFSAYALPITFEGVPESVCRTLKGFYRATK